MREEFGTHLKNHDWYYQYSDDHRYWSAGLHQARQLRLLHKLTECPFEMAELRKWAHNMVIGQFKEETPGKWYRQPHTSPSIAPVTREDLLTQSEWNFIQAWMNQQ